MISQGFFYRNRVRTVPILAAIFGEKAWITAVIAGLTSRACSYPLGPVVAIVDKYVFHPQQLEKSSNLQQVRSRSLSTSITAV